jgi:hypothetical protein
VTPRTLITICSIDLAIWAIIVGGLIFSNADQATKGLDTAAAGLVTILLAVTTLPAILLTRLRRAPRLALALALTFPAVLAVVVAVVAASLP